MFNRDPRHSPEYERGVREAAIIAGTYCWNRQVEGGQLSRPAVFTTHTHQSISEAIHAALDVEPRKAAKEDQS